MATVITAVAIAAAAPAVALNTKFWEYGSAPLCGDLNASTFIFENQPSYWTSSLKADFEDGFDAWVYDVERYWGGYLLSESGTEWVARWDNISGNAQTFCSAITHDITFNIAHWLSYSQGTHNMESISAHEWGHAFGLGHVGENDAHPGSANPPTMSTCVPSGSNARASLSNDDEAAITAQNESVSGYETATANSSFEENESNGIGYWYKQNVTYFTRQTSGGGANGSPSYGRFVGNGASNAAVYNDTYLTWESNDFMKGRVNYKKFSSSDTGYITLTFKTALYNHSSSSCGGLESTTYIGPWIATSKNCTPSTGWGFCTTNALWHVGAEDNVYRGRIVVYNHMDRYIPGVGTFPQYIRIDRTRTMIDN